MARYSVLREGSSVLVFGVFLIVLGLLMNLHLTSMVNYLSNVFGDASLVEGIGLIVVLVGAVLFAYGISMSVSGIVEAKLQKESGYLASSVVATLLPAMRNELAAAMASRGPRKCKFCGAELQEGMKFCTSCGKAQT